MLILIICEWLRWHCWSTWSIGEASLVLDNGDITKIHVQRRKCELCGFTETLRLPG